MPTDLGRSSAGVCGDVWVPTGSMAEGRYIATATRLPDGTVLVAGGTGDFGLVAGAERYNPATGIWSAAGTLITPRYFHKATLLQNGKVLVVGGYGDAGPTATAEIYDPATNTWSPAASMSTDRYAFQLAALSDGRVLASGGIGQSQASLASAEIYDPARNTWSAAGTMTSPRYLAGAAVLSDGRVLVAGGHDGVDYQSSAEFFNPATRTWSAAPSMSVTRAHNFGMSVLPDGRVIAAGGTEQAPGAEIFNPATGSWSPTTDMAQVPRYFFETIPLVDGRIVVAGGIGATGWLDGAELFDVGLGGWSSLGAMSTSRYLAASAELLDGRVLVVGGFTVDSGGSGFASATAETYLPCPSNARPVAVCQNRTISAGPTCQGASVSIDNGSYDPDNGPLSPPIFSQAPSAPFNLGSTFVTLNVSDGSLAASCSATVTVVDNTPPQIICPTHQTLECIHEGANATFTAQIIDNCDPARTVTCTPGGSLPFGDTTVTCSGRDSAGNTRSCSFTASVVDTQPPVAGPSRGLVLSPADSRLEEVSLMDCAGFLVDACSGRLIPLKDHAEITKITSDEVEDAPGGSDGATVGDMQIKKPWLALLRAERDTARDGRVYTIHYRAWDLSGNFTNASCKVTVPKTPNTPAGDGPPLYCVGPDCP